MRPTRRSYAAFSEPCCSFCSLLRYFHPRSAPLISKTKCVLSQKRAGAAGQLQGDSPPWQQRMVVAHSVLLGSIGAGRAVKLPHKYCGAPCWTVGSKQSVSSFLLQGNVQQVVIISLFQFWFCFR